MVAINPHTTRATGTVLTAAIYNGDHVNHVNNCNALNAAKLEAPLDASGTNVTDGTVTNAKLANMPARSIKLRNSAAAGVPQDAIFTDITTDVPVSGDFALGWNAAGSIRKFNVVNFGGSAVSMSRRVVTGADTIVAGDKGNVVEITSGGNFTLAFTAAATLATGFWCFIANQSTGDVALDPNGAELIDGLSTWTLYPGGVILVQCNGSAFESQLLTQMRKQFDSSGTFVKPGVGSSVRLLGHGGGGGGGRANAAGNACGGGGGSCKEVVMLLSVIGATESVTIGAGGIAGAANDTNGAVGGNTTFGSLFTIFGGGGGGRGATASSPEPGQGGMGDRAGLTATSISGVLSTYTLSNILRVVTDTVGGTGAKAAFTCCAPSSVAAASAVNGGSGGGGKQNATLVAAGTSVGIGGSGGASGVAGSVPGGGGGGNVNATAGAGAAGRLIIEIR